MKRPLSAVALALLLATTAGCADYTTTGVPQADGEAAPATESLAPAEDPLAGTSWALESSTAADLASFPINASFTDGLMAGQAPVNTYTTSYEVQADDQIELGPVATTKMAGEPAAMQAETEFLQLLEEVDGFVVSDTQLQLIAGDEAVLTFKPGTAGGTSTDQMEAETAKTEAFAQTLVGKSAADAEAATTEAGFTYRVISEDGQPQAVTSDYRTDRVTVELVDGKVTKATAG
jgi:heat shock protein HslJ